MGNQYSLVITTVSSSEEVEKIAKALLSQQLAACVQSTAIKSYYTWKGKMNVDNEQILLIKCKHSDFNQLQQCIKQNHSYEVPEIIELPITDGLPEYLNWINEVTQ